MRFVHPSTLPVPMAITVGPMRSRPGTVVPLRNPSALKIVRDAVNARAASTGGSEKSRLRAIAVGMGEIRNGRSAAWAVTAALRELRGAAPATHTGDAPRSA